MLTTDTDLLSVMVVEVGVPLVVRATNMQLVAGGWASVFKCHVQ